MAKLREVMLELERQGQNPPGDDACIGAANLALLKLLEEEGGWRSLFEDVLEKKPGNPVQFANLWFRAAQYTILNSEHRNGYPAGYDDVEKWKQELERLLLTESPLIRQLMLERNTGTTLYQRYAGPRAILAAMGIKSAVDLGCGGNHGLRGIMLGEPFKPIKDGTGGVLNTWLEKPYALESGLGVDLEDPDSPDIQKWRLACSFYPGELGNMSDFLAFEDRVRKADVGFMPGNILDLPNLGRRFGVGVVSTTLYMMPDRQEELLENVFRVADAAVIQDYAVWEGGRFGIRSFGEHFAYRTYWAEPGKVPLEVFQWKNGRCREVRPGIDLKKFCDIVE